MDEELLTSRRSNLSFVFLFAVSILLLTTHLSGPIQHLKSFLYYVFNPTPLAASRVYRTARNVTSNISDVVAIHQENIALKKNIERYQFLEIEYQRTKEENERLRHLVNFQSPPGTMPVFARVTAREPGSWFQWVLVDRGAESGLFVDAPVVARDGGGVTVCGRVAEVYNGSAKVVLITNSFSAAPVQLRPSGEDGLMEGQNTHLLRVNYLLPGGAIAIGNEVVTSPLSAVFPAGISVGVVQDIVTSHNDTMRWAIVKPALNFNRLREVIVLLPEKR